MVEGGKACLERSSRWAIMQNILRLLISTFNINKILLPREKRNFVVLKHERSLLT